jgi:hypothetical protein
MATHQSLFPPKYRPNVGGKWGDFGTFPDPIGKIASQACPACREMVLVGEYVIVFEAEEIEPGARGEEFERGLGEVLAANSGKHFVKLCLNCVEMQDVIGSIGFLAVRKLGGAPIAALLLFRQLDA